MNALTITDSRNFPGCLAITHEPSGMAVMDGFMLPQQADEALSRLMPLVNWQQDAVTLRARWTGDKVLRQAVYDIAGSHMGVHHRMMVLSDLTFRPKVQP